MWHYNKFKSLNHQNNKQLISMEYCLCIMCSTTKVDQSGSNKGVEKTEGARLKERKKEKEWAQGNMIQRGNGDGEAAFIVDVN